MSIFWLCWWLYQGHPSLKGDAAFGLNAWGIALGVCLLWDVAA